MAESPPQEDRSDPPVRPGWVLLGNGEQHQIAHLGRRLLAKLIDLLVILLVLVPLDLFAEGRLRQAVVYIRNVVAGEPVDPDNIYLLLHIAITVMTTALFVYLLAFSYDMLFVGYTPGKGVMHIRIVSVDDGSKPRFRQICKRWIILNPPLWLLVLAGLIGVLGQLASLVIYLSPVWNSQRRGWHDKKAGTVVVNAS